MGTGAKMKKTFNQTGTFQAINKAEKWARDNGYSYGIMCRDMPIAIKKGPWNIAKWKNLTGLERLDIDGHITSRDFRNGPVTVEIFERDEG